MNQLDPQIDEQIKNSAEQAVGELVRPLIEEIEELRESLFEQRSTITHREACRYFDGRIKPQRVKDFIRARKLPQGIDVPLPANKIGQQYFIRTDDLERWQAGECSNEDLYEWQRELLSWRQN